ncbi:peptidase inhibitor family I36 protein [Micromonosporaceae bacterium B7E4]
MLAAIGALVPLPAAAAGSQPVSAMQPPGMAETLKANPGSVRTGENTVLLKPGVMVALPSNGDVTTQSLGQCPAGWLCGWVDSDYRGAMYGIRQGDHIDFLYWWYNPYNGATVYDDWGSPGPEWRRWGNSITSVYNNTSLLWTPFYSYRNGENFYARRGAPSPYVGAKWNDSFTKACAC